MQAVRHSLCSQLDELAEELGSPAHLGAEAKLRGHPVLQLVEAPHDPLQVGRGHVVKLLRPDNVVDHFHLRSPRRQLRGIPKATLEVSPTAVWALALPGGCS